MANSSGTFNLIVNTYMYSIDSAFIGFGFGLIGNLLNILVFTSLKVFRNNRCAFYLIVESIVDIGQLSQNFVNQIWTSTISGLDPMSVSLPWCKLRNMLTQWFRLMLSSIVCFAAFDQFLCTNYIVYLRQLSSLKLAKWQIFCATLLCLLHTIPYGIFFQNIPLLGCIITNINLKQYSSIVYYPVLNGFFPIFISSLFSILAYRNVRRIVRRQIPINRRRLDQQLTAMVFVRIIAFVSLLLPYTVYQIYSYNTAVNLSDPYSTAVSQLVYSIVFSLIFINHAISFYIYWATSVRFRRQVKHLLMRKYWRSLKQCYYRRRNIVHPLQDLSSQLQSEM